MKTNKTLVMACAAMMAFASCIDNDYSLSDVDTNVRVKVNDLAVPINLSDIALKSVLDIDDNGKIKNVNGEYAIVVEGEYASDVISIPPFTAVGTTSSVSERTITKNIGAALAKARSGSTKSDILVSYSLEGQEMTVSASSKTVHDAIDNITSLDVNTTATIDIDVDDKNALEEFLDTITVEGLVFEVPAGIEGEAYVVDGDGKIIQQGVHDTKKNTVSFEKEGIVTDKGMIHLRFDVTRITQEGLDGVLKEIEGAEENEFEIKKTYKVRTGAIVIREEDFKESFLVSLEAAAKLRARIPSDLLAKVISSLPDNLNCKSVQKLESVVVNEISGKVDYTVEGLDLDDIKLDDVPDMLTQTGTDIKLANPQIYMRIANPLKDAKGTIPASARMKLTAKFANGKTKEYDMDANSSLVADENKNEFCISPSAVDKFYEGFDRPKHVSYSKLGEVLSGDGIPASIAVEVYDANVKKDDVENFKLANDLGKFEGSYVFYAPLALTENSVIAYADTLDGWYNEDLEGLTVEKLGVDAVISTDVPFDLELEVCPIDIFGKVLANKATARIPANATSAAVSFSINGTMKNIDGIMLKARATAKGNKVLTPEMSIRFESLKPRISGYYDTEL